jgi:hypothetical protein
MSCQPLGRWIRGGCGLLGIVTSENEFCKNPMSKDTITTIYSVRYDAIGGHKHSLDQDTRSLGYRPYTAARQGPMLFETTRQYAEDLSLGSKNEPGKAAERAISQSIEKTRKEVISVLHSLR